MTGGISKRVLNAKKNINSKKGGARSGMLSGLVSTSALAGVALFRSIKRRTGLNNNRVLELFKSGATLNSFLEEGFRTKDLVENIGIASTTNLLIKSSDNAKKIFNDLNVSDEDLILSGVEIKENGELDFTKYDFKKAFKETSIRPTQFALAIIEFLKPVNTFIQSQPTINKQPLSAVTKLVTAAEIADVYLNLDETQKANADAFAQGLGYGEMLQVLNFDFIFQNSLR